MAKQAVYQVRMDADIKDQVEELYRGLGTTFALPLRKQSGFLPFRAFVNRECLLPLLRHAAKHSEPFPAIPIRYG